MSVQPDNVEPITHPPRTPRARLLLFSRRLGIVVGVALAASLAVALMLGQFDSLGVSNAFFWAAFVLLIFAAVPIVAELGTGFTLAGRAAVERKSMRSLLKKEKEKRDRGASRTFLFGLAGILLFVLSFAVSLLGD